jgi:ribosome-associated protein
MLEGSRNMNDLFVNSRLTIAENELTVTVARGSGPGGQNVNKVNSKVVLRWSPARCATLSLPWRQRFMARFHNQITGDGELVLHSDKYRDQPRNLADVRQKLVNMLLACQAAPKPRKETRPSQASKRRRLEEKQQQSQKKQNRGGNWREQ